MVILVTNTKGGVGKSTIAVHMLAWLHSRGQSVVFLDTDQQKTGYDWARRALPELPAVHESDPEEIVAKVRKLDSEYDFVVCDSPGSYSMTTTMLPILSDLAVLPLQPSDADIDELSKALFHIQVAKQRGSKKGLDAVLVLNLTAPNDARSIRLKAKLKKLKIRVAKQPIRRLNAIRDSAKNSVVIGSKHPRSRGASKDFEKLFSEIFKKSLRTRKVAANG